MKHLLSVCQLPQATLPSTFHLPQYFSFLSHPLSLNFSPKCLLDFSGNAFCLLTNFQSLVSLLLSFSISTFLSLTLSFPAISPFQSLSLSISQKHLLSIPLLFSLSVFIPPLLCLSRFLPYFGSL